MANNHSEGGAFLPSADYTVTGDWVFEGTVTNTGTLVETGTAIALTDTTNQIVTGDSGNLTTSNYPASSGAVTLTFPNTSTTIVGHDTTDTLTNKTLSADVLTACTVTTSLLPTTNDGAPLGSTAAQFSDLFLAEGGVVNWDNGDATLTQTGNVVLLAGAALANSSPGTAANSVVTIDGTQTLTAKTITGAIDTDFKVLAAAATYDNQGTPQALTGFSWTVVAGTYQFEINLPTTMTTSGGLELSFVLTTAVLTSIQYQTYAATADDGGTGVSTNGTTTTSATKIFDSKTAAYTHVSAKGSMVVGTGGTFAWFACQETAAASGDSTIVALGSYARLTRVA